MTKLFKNEKIFVFALIFAGLLSLLINVFINYEVSLSKKNKRAYELKEKLSRYPKPLVIFSIKGIEKLNATDLIETQTWLDENNFTQSKIEINNENLNVYIKYSSNFQLSKYLNKIVSLTNVNIKNISIKFNKNEIHLVLGKINSM